MALAATIRASQAAAIVVAGLPSEGVRASQAAALIPVSANGGEVRVAQAAVIIVAAGRIDDPKVRAWTFTMDGHDYYVLRLGNDSTLVFDLFSEQWYVFGSGDSDLWRAFTGQNWLGGRTWATEFGSNVLVGDDGNGAVYFLDPTSWADDDAIDGSSTPRQFLREITGQITTKGVDWSSCFGVQLIGAIGEITDATLTDTELETSDDRGHTYTSHGVVSVDPGEYSSRIEWWSLGSFPAPGRLFKVSDYGALQRIDNLEMLETPDG